MKPRARTLDRESAPVLTAEQIGEKRHRTPEGFLLCLDVPVARVGEMIYGPDEVPVQVGPDGVSRVVRDEQELFSPQTLASYTAKPVVNEHPEEDVTPANWKELSIGVVLSPRRGTGDDSDVMLADLLITDAAAIRDVEDGKREVSAGYDADYEQTGPGRGRQTNIRGNHVALVERGRCGPRCAIGDHQPKELEGMATNNKGRVIFADKIRKVFKDAGEELAQTMPEVDPADGSPEDKDTHVHIHMGGAEGAAAMPGKDAAGEMGGAGDDPVEARFLSLEQGHTELKAMLEQIMAKLGDTSDEADPATVEADGPAGRDALGGADEVTAKDGMPDEVEAAMAAKTNDSAALETYFKVVQSDAEVLLPGFKAPAFNPKAKRKATMDSMCGARRAVLSSLLNTNDGAALISTVHGSPVKTFDSMSCVAVASIFRAAAGAQRAINNGAGTRDASRLPNEAAYGAKPALTPAILNKQMREYYSKQ